MFISVNNFDINKIANSGQCFRFNKIGDNTYENIASKYYFVIKQIDHKKIQIDCLNNNFKNKILNYFYLLFNYNNIYKIVNKNDIFLKNCFKFGNGLKILKQEPFEMLISFIISQRKSINAIKTSIKRLCEVCNVRTINNKNLFAFPDAKTIYDNKNQLYKCGLGYREEYIIDTIKCILNNNIDLNSYNNFDNSNLKNKLMEFKGVGEKVASCVMLFAYSRYDICPVDVWINRVLNKYYNNKIPKEYNKYAGIIQQYWFFYSKENKISI